MATWLTTFAQLECTFIKPADDWKLFPLYPVDIPPVVFHSLSLIYNPLTNDALDGSDRREGEVEKKLTKLVISSYY